MSSGFVRLPSSLRRCSSLWLLIVVSCVSLSEYGPDSGAKFPHQVSELFIAGVHVVFDGAVVVVVESVDVLGRVCSFMDDDERRQVRFREADDRYRFVFVPFAVSVVASSGESVTNADR